ncbi:MAG: hypothetical protein ACFFCD_09635 [Promethearchaeota archaeon]
MTRGLYSVVTIDYRRSRTPHNVRTREFTRPDRHIIPYGSRIVVIDENEILFTFSGVQEHEIGIWAKNPGLVGIFRFFFEQFWNIATLEERFKK